MTWTSETHYTYRIKALNAQRRKRQVHLAARPHFRRAPAGKAHRPDHDPVVAHDHVDLSWDDPEDTTITGYEILRRDKDVHQQGVFDAIEADTGSPATTYADDTVLAQKRYVYRIKALNATGKSEISEWVRGYTPAAPASAPQESDSASQRSRQPAGRMELPETTPMPPPSNGTPSPATAWPTKFRSEDHRGRQWVDLGERPSGRHHPPKGPRNPHQGPGAVPALRLQRGTGRHRRRAHPHAGADHQRRPSVRMVRPPRGVLPLPVANWRRECPAAIMTQAGQAILSWPSPSYFGNRTFTLLDTHIVYRMNRSLTNLPTDRDRRGGSGGRRPRTRGERRTDPAAAGPRRERHHGHCNVQRSRCYRTTRGDAGIPVRRPPPRDTCKTAADSASWPSPRGPGKSASNTVLDTPGRPEATQTASVQVSLSWNAIEDATQYRLRLWADDQWEELDGRGRRRGVRVDVRRHGDRVRPARRLPLVHLRGEGPGRPRGQAVRLVAQHRGVQPTPLQRPVNHPAAKTRRTQARTKGRGHEPRPFNIPRQPDAETPSQLPPPPQPPVG